MGQHVKICVLHQFFEVFLHVATLVGGEVVVTNAVYCVRLTNEYKSYSIRQRKNITHKLQKHAGTVFAHCFVFRYSCCQKSQDSHTTYMVTLFRGSGLYYILTYREDCQDVQSFTPIKSAKALHCLSI